MENCEEKLVAMSDKLAQYEKLIESLSSVKRTIGTITGGPFRNGSSYYRVMVDGSEAVYKYAPMGLGDGEFTPDTLEHDSEVLILSEGEVSTIVSLTPGSLRSVHQKPQYFEKLGWDEIGGLDDQIDQIRQSVELPINNKHLAEELNIPMLKGILLYGPPGCGKTMIAKAIASSVFDGEEVADEAFTYVKGAELLDMYVGSTERQIKQIFDNARRFTAKTGEQSVIFIDEADALLPARGTRRSSDVDRTIVPTFLSEMDGLQGNAPMVILCTNMAAAIDEAVIRPGRVDMKLLINRPNKDATKDIYDIHLGKTKVAEDPDTLSREAADFIWGNEFLRPQVSGAMIANSVSSAARLAMKRKLEDEDCMLGVTFPDIKHSLKTMIN